MLVFRGKKVGGESQERERTLGRSTAGVCVQQDRNHAKNRRVKARGGEGDWGEQRDSVCAWALHSSVRLVGRGTGEEREKKKPNQASKQAKELDQRSTGSRRRKKLVIAGLVSTAASLSFPTFCCSLSPPSHSHCTHTHPSTRFHALLFPASAPRRCHPRVEKSQASLA